MIVAPVLVMQNVCINPGMGRNSLRGTHRPFQLKGKFGATGEMDEYDIEYPPCEADEMMESSLPVRTSSTAVCSAQNCFAFHITAGCLAFIHSKGWRTERRACAEAVSGEPWVVSLRKKLYSSRLKLLC